MKVSFCWPYELYIFPLAPLHHVKTNVKILMAYLIVPVADTALVRMRRAHAVAAIVEEVASQKGRRASERDLLRFPGD